MEYVLTSMDMFASTTENLISFTFNVRTLLSLVLVTETDQLAEYLLPNQRDHVRRFVSRSDESTAEHL